ncbi:ABC transporter permease [Deminuibacter soli]|uniref:ABC transporter permease n=1 Tax=Deminuibacter soli TaxID=2291815 RepID=A0A3E1NQF4_9BACT|nr:ABC transporter permease [Deminuibacter soli]RFM30153.1 ABC transporter permease [Deminuibacter soli]
MLKNYLLIAWRNLLKSKAYSSINILGLAAGMAVALLIGLWIYDELSFDHYHARHNRLGRVMTTQTFNDHTGTHNAVSIPLGYELREKYRADFKNVTLASWNFSHVLAVGDKKISQSGMWVHPEFPGMLSLKMIQGNINALNAPYTILLTESVAKTLFGNTNPMNKIIKLDNKHSVKVAGVYEDLPHNTSFFDTKFFMPWDTYVATEKWLTESRTQWGNHSFQLFVELNDNADFDAVTRKIANIAKEHVKEGNEHGLVHPMDKWHLYSEFKDGRVKGGRIHFVWLFGAIGIFVLLLACINFMNLSTARSEKRAKEVGIRKAIGSLRRQLMGQFLSESIVVAFLSLLLAIILVVCLLPFFNSIADKHMRLPWGNPIFWSATILFTFLTGLVSGSYPAFYLSSFEPIKVLKGTFKTGRFAALPRKILVVIQFTVSVTLVIGTIIVYKQIQYAKDRPVGYSRAGLIMMNMQTPEINGHYDALRGDLLKTGVVENMAESSSPATEIWSNQIGFDWKGKDPNTTPVFGIQAVTHDYGKTIDWQIKEGRDFSRNFTTDSGALILNEAAVKLTGLKNPVGELIKWNDKERRVTGIVKDMVMESPYEPVKPTVFFLDYGWTQVITIRVKPTVAMHEAISKIEPIFRSYDPGSPFDYKFIDQEYAQKFSDEERIGHLATFFAILAIFISCLGLFGLASFVAEQRTKEIGVRKVLGASVFTLWGMLSKDFVTLVSISSCIAVPIAWYALYIWLQNYEYHTPIYWWIFVAAILGALAITLMTVSYQAIRAALMNPVKSLRSE